MSDRPEHSDDLRELIYQLPGEARLRELDQRLWALPLQERLYWLALIAEVDQIRASLAGNHWTSQMEAKLLEIPRHTPPISPMQRLLQQPVGPVHYLLGLLALAALIGAIIWFMQPPPRALRPQLNHRIADAISSMAIAHHSDQPQIKSADPSAVENALTNHGLPFVPVVLQPDGNLALIGGGSFEHQSTAVAFTRWKGDGATYTLYQFNAKQLGAPTDFAQMIDNAGPNQRVVLWPAGDGTSAWALVLENPHATDMFSSGCR